MNEYNEHNIYFVTTQEAINWKGRHIVARTTEGIEIEGVVTGFDMTGSTINPQEWLGVHVEGKVTLTPDVIKRMQILSD